MGMQTRSRESGQGCVKITPGMCGGDDDVAVCVTARFILLLYYSSF